MTDRTADASAIWYELRLVWPALDWPALEVVHGAFHQVAVLGTSGVIRVATGTCHASRARDELANLQAVATLELPYAVPRPNGEVYSAANWSATLMDVVPGELDLTAPWQQVREQVARALQTLHAAAVSASLRPARQWCGGETWPRVVDEITHALGRTLRAEAARVVADVAEVERSAPRCFVHGDFGPHNLLFLDGRISGLIDFDNACVGDPAMDFAPLVGVYGSAAVAQIANPETVERARIHRASLSLQVAAAAQLVGDAVLRNFALSNFAARVDAGTLYEPAPQAVHGR